MPTVSVQKVNGIEYSIKDADAQASIRDIRKAMTACQFDDYKSAFFITDSDATGDYASVDTFPIGRSVLCSGVTSAAIANLPVSPFTGYITTICYQGNNGTGNNNQQFTAQIAQSVRSNDMFIRAKYAAWDAWMNITGNMELAVSIFGDDSFFTDGNISQFPGYEDCNTVPPLTIAMYYAVSSLAHKPTAGAFTGYILTINYHKKSGGGNRDFSVQYAHTCGNGQNEIYYRAKYSSWTEWERVGAGASGGNVVLNAYKGLKNFTVLGDSISVSLSYPTMSPSYTVTSWAKIMADSMGATADIYAQGGRTTAAMLAADDYPTAVANADGNQFAIIALGINDANNEVSSDTFKSNYTQLINDMLTNHKFVFCCTIPAGLKGTERSQYNNDIKTVAASISNAFVVDVDEYSSDISPLCHLGHMSSVGYAALASFIEKAIDNTIAANSYFLTGTIDQ